MPFKLSCVLSCLSSPSEGADDASAANAARGRLPVPGVAGLRDDERYHVDIISGEITNSLAPTDAVSRIAAQLQYLLDRPGRDRVQQLEQLRVQVLTEQGLQDLLPSAFGQLESRVRERLNAPDLAPALREALSTAAARMCQHLKDARAGHDVNDHGVAAAHDAHAGLMGAAILAHADAPAQDVGYVVDCLKYRDEVARRVDGWPDRGDGYAADERRGLHDALAGVDTAPGTAALEEACARLEEAFEALQRRLALADCPAPPSAPDLPPSYDEVFLMPTPSEAYQYRAA